MSWASWRAATSAAVTSPPENGAPISSPRNSVTRRCSAAGTCSATRARRRSRRSASGSPPPMPSAPRSAWASRSSVEPARSESPRPIQIATCSSRCWTRLASSAARRDLPIPAAAVTTTARAFDSSMQSSRIAVRMPSSQSRPTHEVGRPRSVRAPRTSARSPWSERPASPSTTSKRASSRPAITSSSAIGGGASGAGVHRASSDAARSIAEPSGSFRVDSSRPIASAIGRAFASSRNASAQRAARAAWSVATSRSGSITAMVDPSASRSRRPPNGALARRSASSSTSSSSVAGPSITTDRNRRSPPVSVVGFTACSAPAAGIRVAPDIEGRSTASAAASWTPSFGRFAGSFASIWEISASRSWGTSGHRSLTRGTSPNRISLRMLAALSPSNAGMPVKHWYSTHPRANTSARASISPLELRACSGAMYPGVPISIPVFVRWARPSRRAIPKSRTLT